MRKVIVNSTPLIVLCSIGRLEILQKMYAEITIPAAVYREVTEKKMYKAKLHDGEVEVMILCQEQNADLAIIDDNAAKKTAKYLGIPVTGTLGVLIKAKQQGFINEIRPIISELKANGFYVSQQVEELVLKYAGEM